MAGKIKLQLVTMRHRKAVIDLAHKLEGLPGLGAWPDNMVDRAAEAYLAVALRDGFSLGNGADRVAMLAGRFGIGFLQDRQYSQLLALFRDDVRADEPWRLALLEKWHSYASGRAGPFSPVQCLASLRQLASIIEHYGAQSLASDPVSLFNLIGPQKTALHDADAWYAIRSNWYADFTHSLPGASPAQLDYACALAFCCGQHFAFDPLWDRLSDLRAESLRLFLN